ncbi:MAG: glutathione S-transferase N-terminal domain-containing protein, partial [Alphaproteobacteria bacterium]|nr:glutathione S-transferase N-terminal domain-containing protein [Alphaproteobacteria bacterium]
MGERIPLIIEQEKGNQDGLMVNSTLVLANKNYSSWSLRAWLVCTHSGLAFEEVVIPLRESVTHETILRHTPSGKLPVLVHGD